MNKGISSFTLHIIAIVLMFADHLWATILPAQEWLTCIGRIAFPLFAFMIVEGYYHTSNINKYMKRLLFFAIISEIPFNLIYGSSMIYPFHQNVLWIFLIALVAMRMIDKVKEKNNIFLTISLSLIIVFIAYLTGMLAMVDYYGEGVLMVLVFYFFHGRNIICFIGQLISLAYINTSMLGTYYYPISIMGYDINLYQQSFALFSLIFIWLYNGRQGYHAKWFQYACYGFYPVHLLLLYMIWQYVL